jgi:hypothetical protein
LDINKRELFAGGKERTRVRARSLFCFPAVRELVVGQAELAKLLKLSPAALTFAVKRGELLAREKDISLLQMTPCQKCKYLKSIPKSLVVFLFQKFCGFLLFDDPICLS